MAVAASALAGAGFHRAQCDPDYSVGSAFWPADCAACRSGALFPDAGRAGRLRDRRGASPDRSHSHALLPLVRGVVTGLQQVPQDALESATAMGMSAGQRFRRVQLPLAMPVLLRSLRVVSVQTVGMAVVAALIGAGGFGALVFQGLLSSALDLVLLGVVPTIAGGGGGCPVRPVGRLAKRRGQ